MDGTFDIRGGGAGEGLGFKKNSLFPIRSKKINFFKEVKNKKFVLH